MPSFHRSRPRRRPVRAARRGAMLILVTLLLPVLLVIVGFAVDLATMQLTRSELRAATDLAAKSAAAELSATGATANAIQVGKDVASENLVAGQALVLENADFVFGAAAPQSGGQWTFVAGGAALNAVRITGRRTTGSPSGPVNLYFGTLFGTSSFQPLMTSTASFVDVDICLVLDRSSSMKLAVTDPAGGMSGGDPRECETPWADSRWTAVETAVQAFIAEMNASTASEQVALVTFSSDHEACGYENEEATTDEDLTFTLSNITSAMATRSTMIWNGNTNIDSGIVEGQNVLTGSNARPLAQKVMIVLTDGVYTGNYPVPYAEDAHDDDIKIHTITFGDNANQADMQAVAAAGGGIHYHAADAVALNSVFRELAATISILTE